MRVLFDTNIVLDILLKRQGFAESALALAKTPDPCLSALSLANVCYIVGRSKSRLIKGPLAFMRAKFQLVPLTSDTIARAVDLAFEDFEDALQVASGEAGGASHLVTRNLSDFRPTKSLSVVSVDQLLVLLLKP